MTANRGAPGRIVLGIVAVFFIFSGAEVLAVSTEPTDAEQYFIYILNRARSDPQTYEDEVGLPNGELDGVAARPPLALSKMLVTSSRFHSDEMATNDYFAHQSAVTGDWPNKMALDAGYSHPWTPTDNYIESIAGGYSTPDAALKALIWDVGVPSLGHRKHLLAIDAFFQAHREVGVGYAYNAGATYWYYWSIHTGYVNASDLFVTGVVYNDANSNSRYDIGEGLGGVTVDAGAAGSTITGAAGGWSIAVTDGSHTVTCSGGSFSGTGTASVTVAGTNKAVDFISGRANGILDFGSPPVADIVASTTTEYRSVSLDLDGTGSSDVDGPIDTYTWTSAPSAGVVFGDASADTTTVTFANLGTHTITLAITDLDGGSDSTTVDINIVNKPPSVTTLTATPNPVDTLANVDLLVTATDDDGTVDTYEWDTDGDGFDDGALAALTVVGGWADDGVYTVRVRVTDNDGASTIDSVDVTVNNQAPVAASVGPGSPPFTVEVGEVFTVSDDGSSDVDGTVSVWSWDFGDGEWPVVNNTAADVDYYWTSTGGSPYSVVLTVTDDDGETDAAPAIVVTVIAATDLDTDGLPDGWETTHFADTASCDPTEDAALDNDGLTNLEEFLNRTDPNAADSDSDGLSDGDEVNTTLTDPASADTDGDGYSDGNEVSAGSDPLNALSMPAPPSSKSSGGCSASSSCAETGAWWLPLLGLAAALVCFRRRAAQIRSRV